MPSGKVVLGGRLSLVVVEPDDQYHRKIAEDDDVIRKGKVKSCHRRLLEGAADVALNISFDDNKSAPETLEFSACEKIRAIRLFDTIKQIFDIDKRWKRNLESRIRSKISKSGNRGG
jgi:hypothetical protein